MKNKTLVVALLLSVFSSLNAKADAYVRLSNFSFETNAVDFESSVTPSFEYRFSGAPTSVSLGVEVPFTYNSSYGFFSAGVFARFYHELSTDHQLFLGFGWERANAIRSENTTINPSENLIFVDAGWDYFFSKSFGLGVMARYEIKTSKDKLRISPIHLTYRF